MVFLKLFRYVERFGFYFWCLFVGSGKWGFFLSFGLGGFCFGVCGIGF